MPTEIQDNTDVEEIFTDLTENVVKYSTMSDEHDIIKIIEKVADINNIGKIICGEENSNMLTFEINRYYDNVDLKDKNIRIIYKNGLGIFKEDAVNIRYSDAHVRFSWVLSYNISSVSGNVVACVNFFGKDEFGNNYSLKTANFKLSVDSSLDITSITIDDSKNWFVDIENRLSKIENNGGIAEEISYHTITNKPEINGVTLEGNKTLDELNIQEKGDYAKSDHTHSDLHTHENKNILDSITNEKVTSWDNKSDFSGSYNDLTDVPNVNAGIYDYTYIGVDLTEKFADEISEYSDEWAWIKARKESGNYEGIHVGDYIPVTCNNGFELTMQILGINTYTGYGNPKVGNHIDFGSMELWQTYHPMNKVFYNNGNANDPNPFLASDLNYWLNSMSGSVPNSETDPNNTVEVDYTESGVLYYLPDKVKNQIIKKHVLLPCRYDYEGGTVLSDDDSGIWSTTGKIWIPSEIEVYGNVIYGNLGYGASGFTQYPLFACNMRNRSKKIRMTGRYLSWWLLSEMIGNSEGFAVVNPYGALDVTYSCDEDVSTTVNFRI